MKTILNLSVALILSIVSFLPVSSQTNTCFTANPFCSSSQYNFPNATSGTAPSGPSYGCLTTRPKPIWYYMEIDVSGTIDISLQQTSGPNGTGSQRDVDFAMWGPFSSLNAGCNAIMAGGLPPIQCSYSSSYSEDIGIGVSGGTGSGASTPPAAQAGQFYIVLLTNYHGSSGYISFNQTGGTGSADCSLVEPCSISNFVANVSACASQTANYSVSGTINVSNPPSTGQLIVEDCNGNQTIVASAPFNASSYPYNLTGLVANGTACSVEAYFSNDAICSALLTYTAPLCNGCSMSDITANIGLCQTDGTYGVSGAVSFSNPPATGTMTVSTSCGGTQTFNAPFTSPMNYSITGLPADGNPCNVSASFSAISNCQTTTPITAPTFLTPIFDTIFACIGSPPPALPATSAEAIPGTWSSSTINTATAGTSNYTFTPSSNECAGLGTLVVVVNPITNNTDNITICQNALPYTWNGQTIAAGGNAVATHTTQDANGCDVVTTLNLTVNPVTNLTETVAICIGALPYTWRGQTITAAGNGVATSTAQNASGCNEVTTLNLTITPGIQLTDNITICSSQLPYTWNGQTVTAGGTGVATQTIQDPTGCDVTTTLNLTVTNAPTIAFNVNYTPCIPAEVVVTPASTQPNLNYTWIMNGAVIGNSNSAFNLNINNAGCYDLTLNISTPDGCTSTSFLQPAFCVDQSPIANFTYPGEANSTATGDVQTTNLSSNATSYHWVVSNGASSTEVSPLLPFSGTTGVHSVTLYAYSANGCVDSITKTISVKEEIIFYIPNSFTPDGDEFNHLFGPVITSGIDLHNYKFSIYNRWGEMIFESNDASVPWDGTYKGKMVQDGTYTWELEFLERNTDARHHYVGHVNLIR
jgi:gliding motility-associated-like protein